MPQFPALTLKERKKQEESREKQIQQVFASRNKALENSKREKQQKKKSVGELFGLLNFCGIEGAALRPANTYQSKSHNLDRQVMGLLNHMFVRYPVPAFLYQACFRNTG